MKKQLVKLLSYISPKMIANIAYNALTNPQVKKLRANEMVTLDKAKKEIFKFGTFDIQTYQWGNEQQEKILLVHGWEGQAGNFSDIVEQLLKHNYHIVAFDGPSHGFSSKGQTSPFEFGALVGALIKLHRPKKIISHSFGGVATTLALYENQAIPIEKYALLTTPDSFSQRIDDVVAMVGTTDKVKNILINRLEKELDIKVKDLNVSDYVKQVNVKQALIIHDKDDKVIPIAQSKNVYNNWKNCQFETVEGTGHFRILRTEKVIDRVLKFMN